MNAYVQIFLALLIGLCLGSFYNVVIARSLEPDLNIFSPKRSVCTSCKHTIFWYHNIPIISWILLKGRCAYCHQPISIQYLVVEALTAIISVLIIVNYGISLLSLQYFFLCSIMIIIGAIDLKHFVVPLSLALLLILGAATLLVLEALWPLSKTIQVPSFSSYNSFYTRLVAGAVGGFIMSTVLLIFTYLGRKSGRITNNQNAMGWGDPLIVVGMGLVLGVWLPFAIFLASIQGIIAFIFVAKLTKKRQSVEDDDVPKGAIPLVPFLALASLELVAFIPFLSQHLG